MCLSHSFHEYIVFAFVLRYLESFERINFSGEDAEDVLSAGRPHTPVGGGTFPAHVPSVITSGMWLNKHRTPFNMGENYSTTQK